MTDHVCEWAAASPARYRASSSAKAASMSSRSNKTCAAIRSSVSISTMPSTRVRTALPLVAVRGTDTSEGEALPAGRDDGRRHVRARPSSRARMFAITASRPSRNPAFTTRRRSSTKLSSARISAIAAQLRAAKYAKKRSTCSACRVLQPRRRPVAVPRTARVAASRSVSSNISQRLIRSPSTVRMSISRHSASKPSREVAMRRLGDDGSEVAQPMHGLDVDAACRALGPHAARMYAVMLTGLERYPAPVVDVHPIRRRRG